MLDLNFWTRAERDRARRLAAEAGAAAVLYRLAVDEDVAWVRIEARNAAPAASLFIARNTFEALKLRFEPLAADEERIEMG
ncbi:MAG: AAA family ATPase [Devosia sp.]